MTKKSYYELEAGYEFPPASYELERSMVSAYLQAVEETSPRYQDTGLVPPTAVAAYALTALSQGLAMPPGAIHVSQELEFLELVRAGDTITCQAKVSRKQERGKMHIFTIDLNVLNQSGKTVLTGKTSFILS
ncbi:MAG: MaoC family dehydratase N-terminal domain-containing protein [Chloroflexota bacterium]